MLRCGPRLADAARGGKSRHRGDKPRLHRVALRRGQPAAAMRVQVALAYLGSPRARPKHAGNRCERS
eukprot:12952441-Alexandrium_andersonii.AAC.1